MLKQHDSASSVALEYLQHIRPDGPWTLTAIVPDGDTTTKTLTATKDVQSFIDKHNGRRNLYYTINPLRQAMNKKPAKADVAAVEYLQADLDPRQDETPEDAKARYLTAIAALGLEPFTKVDSGNGFQVLYKLDEPTTDFDAAEARSLALTLKLGGSAGTQNVDRLFRLPGTINLPNKRKLKDGRTICESRLISTGTATYPLDVFPAPAEQPKGRGQASDEKAFVFLEASLPPDLLALIRDGVKVGDRSDQFFHAVAWLKDEGWSCEDVVKLLGKYPKGIMAKYGRRYADQVRACYDKINAKPSLDDENSYRY